MTFDWCASCNLSIHFQLVFSLHLLLSLLCYITKHSKMLPSNFSFFQGSMKRKNQNKILLVAQTFNALNMNCIHFVKSDVRRRTYPKHIHNLSMAHKRRNKKNQIYCTGLTPDQRKDVEFQLKWITAPLNCLFLIDYKT